MESEKAKFRKQRENDCHQELGVDCGSTNQGHKFPVMRLTGSRDLVYGMMNKIIILQYILGSC